jgi:hypothetical protein
MLVQRHDVARKTRRVQPLVSATRTQAARPEGVPYGVAAWTALPTVRGGGPPLTTGAIDLGLAFHIYLVYPVTTSYDVSGVQRLSRRAVRSTSSSVS